MKAREGEAGRCKDDHAGKLREVEKQVVAVELEYLHADLQRRLTGHLGALIEVHKQIENDIHPDHHQERDEEVSKERPEDVTIENLNHVSDVGCGMSDASAPLSSGFPSLGTSNRRNNHGRELVALAHQRTKP